MTRRLTMIALPALLLLAAAANAAPAPDPARQSLEALKKKLPDVVSAWKKQYLADGQGAEARLIRRVGQARAKVVVAMGDPKDLARHPADLLTVFLCYHDGCWTTVRFTGSWSQEAGKNWNAHHLMLAIGEAAEK
jgi:hypothetical protein